jgi:hypothetical protein
MTIVNGIYMELKYFVCFWFRVKGIWYEVEAAI